MVNQSADTKRTEESFLWMQVTSRSRLGLARKLLKFLWDQKEFHKNIMDGEEKTYGGCESPDALYVKSVSSDGYEFIVKENTH